METLLLLVHIILISNFFFFEMTKEHLKLTFSRPYNDSQTVTVGGSKFIWFSTFELIAFKNVWSQYLPYTTLKVNCKNIIIKETRIKLISNLHRLFAYYTLPTS